MTCGRETADRKNSKITGREIVGSLSLFVSSGSVVQISAFSVPVSEQFAVVSSQNCGQQFPKHITSQDLPDGDITGLHEVGKIDTVTELQYQRNDQSVGYDRRDGNEPAVETQTVSQPRADQRRKAAENDIQSDRPAQKIREKTADEKPRNGACREQRKDREGFRDPELDRSEGDRRESDRQHDIKGCDRRALRQSSGGTEGVFHECLARTPVTSVVGGALPPLLVALLFF